MQQFRVNSEEYGSIELILSKNEHLLADSFSETMIDADGRRHTRSLAQLDHCYYTGSVRSVAGSSSSESLPVNQSYVAVSTCSGSIEGMVSFQYPSASPHYSTRAASQGWIALNLAPAYKLMDSAQFARETPSASRQMFNPLSKVVLWRFEDEPDMLSPSDHHHHEVTEAQSWCGSSDELSTTSWISSLQQQQPQPHFTEQAAIKYVELLVVNDYARFQALGEDVSVLFPSCFQELIHQFSFLHRSSKNQLKLSTLSMCTIRTLTVSRTRSA